MSTTDNTETESTDNILDNVQEVENVEPEVETTPPDVEDETEPRSEEAKKYRLRLRETEGELADVQQQLDGIQRQVVGQMVEAECQISPEVLWAAGTSMADLVEADGSVNRDAVRQAGDNAAQALNVARSPRSPRPDPNQGRLGAGISSGDSWSNAFAPG